MVITTPSGTADGDLLIAQFQTNNQAPTVTAPAGWTTKDSDTTNANSYLFYKIAASEGASYTFSISNAGGNQAVSGGIIALRNASQSSPFDQQSKNVDTTSDTTANGTAVTPTISPESLLLAFVCSKSSAATTSAYAVANNNPTWTEAWDQTATNTTSGNIALAYASYNFITTTGAFTASMTASNVSTTYLCSIRPASFNLTAGLSAIGTASASVSGAYSILPPAAASVTSLLDAVITQAAALWTNVSKNVVTWINQSKS